MSEKKETKELLQWLEQNPELMTSLKRIQEISENENGNDLSAKELELLELSHCIGRVGLENWVQNQEGLAFEKKRHEPGTRKHSKKN